MDLTVDLREEIKRILFQIIIYSHTHFITQIIYILNQRFKKSQY